SALAADGEHTGADPNEMPTMLPAPRVQSVTINGGDAQRSRVTSVAVVFDTVMTLPANPADAFQLKRQSDNAMVHLAATVVNTAAQTMVTLTFPGAVAEFGSLKDGRYTLTILAGSASSSWGALDGNANGTGGDDFVLASASAPNPATNIFRFF